VIFDDEYFYWRLYKRDKRYFDMYSQVYLEYLSDIKDIRQAAANHDLVIFKGLAPHVNRLYHDRQGETLSAFVDFSTIKVFPLLHTNKIKIKNSRIKTVDSYVLGTMLLNHKLYSLQSNNLLKEFNIMTGKLTNKKAVQGFETYRFQQNINEVQFLLKQTEVLQLKELEHRDQLTFKSVAARDTSVIRFTQYKVISFEDDAGSEFKDIGIREHFTFMGPVDTAADNYGLYLGDTLSKVAFYFRDPARMLIIYYF